MPVHHAGPVAEETPPVSYPDLLVNQEVIVRMRVEINPEFYGEAIGRVQTAAILYSYMVVIAIRNKVIAIK